jgi:copper homeostasis protein (lipoprotein)
MASARILVLMMLTGVTACVAPHPRQADDLANLAGSSWRFVELYGTPVQLPSIPSNRQPLLAFDARGRVFGSDGCNRVLGSYTVEKDRISMSGMAGMQMACLKTGPVTRRLQDALAGTQRWQLDGGLLALYGAAGQTLAILDRLPNSAL